MPPLMFPLHFSFRNTRIYYSSFLWSSVIWSMCISLNYLLVCICSNSFVDDFFPFCLNLHSPDFSNICINTYRMIAYECPYIYIYINKYIYMYISVTPMLPIPQVIYSLCCWDICFGVIYIFIAYFFVAWLLTGYRNMTTN